MAIFKEHDEIDSNVEKFFQKLIWLRNYWALIFEFPAILLLFLETKAPFRMLYLLKQLAFSKSFFTSDSVLSCSFKIQYLFVKSLVEIWILVSILWRLFPSRNR